LVRLFIFLFKLDIHKLQTAACIYNAAMKGFNIHTEPCPGCGAKGHLTWHDEYSHHLTDYYDNKLQEGSVAIRMVSCSSCKEKHTHSVLPDLFVPHMSYSIVFVMLVLRACLLRTESVKAVCARFGISVSTYYRWKKRYCTHKSLYLDKIEKFIYRKDPHLKRQGCRICFTSFPHDFYNRFGFSFLQYSKAAESHDP
jgi:hypothetical protein